MAERKAINKYYPPDFDPSKIIKKNKKVKTGSASLPTVRLMTPFSMKCDNCSDYISKSRKFNARKENTSQTYLGMKIVRFHIKCPNCASEIVFRTDPKSASFVIEFGAKKNYDSANTNQIWKDESVEQILDKLEQEDAEAKLKEAQKDKKVSSLEELEKKMNDLRRQQDMNDEIDELQSKTKRLNESLGSSTFEREYKERIEEALKETQRLQDQSDERLAEEVFKKRKIITETPPENIVATQVSLTSESKADKLMDRDSDSDSDSEYEQPLLQQPKLTIPTKIHINRRKPKIGGIAFKRVEK